MKNPMLNNPFTQQAGIKTPIICGAMYPCSNPELVAAVSEAGGLGVIQPISLTYVHGYDFREGIRFMRQLTDKPLAMNALIEKSSKRYQKRMMQWVDIALEEGIRFFITSLGNPISVVERAHSAGGVVYHDVTERKWALKGMEAGVDGLVAVNNRAGGHAGGKGYKQLYEELADFNVPLICAGGISTAEDFTEALGAGYQGVQMGTRFIASEECNANTHYKNAIISADENDIVLSERVTGVPISLIGTAKVHQLGTKNSGLTRYLLRHKFSKRMARTLLGLKAFKQIRKALFADAETSEYWQAGKSVSGIREILTVEEIIASFNRRLQQINISASFI